jgi:hypothetical protein
MKNRTLLFSLLIGFLFTHNVTAQESRFIELTVSDTILLKSTQIIYQINIGKQEDFLGMNLNYQDDSSEGTLPTLKEVTQLLDKKKFKYTVVTNADYSVSANESKPTIEVALTNEVDLKKLYELVKSKKGLTGKIKEVEYEDFSKYQEKAFKQLYTKARLHASFIATASGNKLGNLISISDVKQGAFDLMAIYKQVMKNMPKLGGFGEASSFESVEVAKMVFKFEIE